MSWSLQRILLAIVAVVGAADLVLAYFGHFDIDGGAYLRLGLLALGLFLGGLFYQDWRPDPRLAAMLKGTGFLIAFSAAASVLNYFLLLHTGARIDFQLARLDRAMGFDWPAVMTAMARHPVLNQMLFFAYGSMLPQIAILLVTLAWSGRCEQVYRFCLALAVGALIAIGVWAFAPSFGAFSVYHLPASVKLGLALDENYARALVGLLGHGPDLITPRNMRGLIGFPSYHAVLAMLVVWYAWPMAWARWPALTLNALVLISTPIQGGHHLIDVLAAAPVTCIALLLARATPMTKPAHVVNKPAKFTIARAPQAVFRTASTQSALTHPRAIKPTLSRQP